MKRSKFSEAQIAFILRQADEGTPVAEVYRKAGISDALDSIIFAHLDERRRLVQIRDELAAEFSRTRTMINDDQQNYPRLRRTMSNGSRPRNLQV